MKKAQTSTPVLNVASFPRVCIYGYVCPILHCFKTFRTSNCPGSVHFEPPSSCFASAKCQRNLVDAKPIVGAYASPKRRRQISIRITTRGKTNLSSQAHEDAEAIIPRKFLYILQPHLEVTNVAGSVMHISIQARVYKSTWTLQYTTLRLFRVHTVSGCSRPPLEFPIIWSAST